MPYFLSRSVKRTSLLLLTAGLLWGAPAAAQDEPAPKPDSPPTTTETDRSQTEAEAAFAEQMSGTVLVGYFTVVDADQPGGGKPERYEIRKVSKVKDSLWMFQTRVKYGSVDTVLPMVLPIEWAGDTPMISMTDFTIPGMGTFSCRVLFHKDRYAGTWQHGPKGGHMWGMIEKAKDQPKQ